MENSTKVLIGVGVLAGTYLIFKNKISISTEVDLKLFST